MNNLIQLSGTLIKSKNTSIVMANKLPKGSEITTEKLLEIKSDLIELYEFWKKETLIQGALVDVEYCRIIPKSKRIQILLFNHKDSNNYKCIKGVKYKKDGNKTNHVITYFIPKENLKIGIERINECIKILNDKFGGKYNNENENSINILDFKKYNISKTNFLSMMLDCLIVKKLSEPKCEGEAEPYQSVTFYDVNMDIQKLLNKIGIEAKEFSVLEDNTMLMNRESFNKLIRNAPYLVSMTLGYLEDYSKIDNDINEKMQVEENIKNIPHPTNEPMIGVLDTGFDKNVYFSEWVDYSEDYLDKEIEINPKDRVHGTEVDSIIVDGPSINPKLDDGCGRFKVKHFCISVQGSSSTFKIMRSIKEIIEENLGIKVWNLSLGTNREINDNFISQVGALIDMLESKYDIIFVIAGTNKTDEDKINEEKKIGSPADSINSIVVNAVKMDGEKTSYARSGRVLEYFNKPDVCYYGGDNYEPIRTCSPTGEKWSMGTSLAAPWIARKVAYLIYKMGLPREIAKALIIDSATGWKRVDKNKNYYYGYGVVPIRIEDICGSKKDEIKFYIESESSEYDTYTYKIPVPLQDGKYPYIAKATLCYFPHCTRNQGVDYTNTELDLYFGRLKKNKKGKIEIESINKNKQTEEGTTNYEEHARDMFEKWNNTKHIVEEYREGLKPRKVYENTNWGLSVKSKDRLGRQDDKGIKFGVVITLKELNGVNRYSDFIKQCMYNGWIVNEINIENRLNLYNVAEENIKFE